MHSAMSLMRSSKGQNSIALIYPSIIIWTFIHCLNHLLTRIKIKFLKEREIKVSLPTNSTLSRKLAAWSTPLKIYNTPLFSAQLMLFLGLGFFSNNSEASNFSSFLSLRASRSNVPTSKQQRSLKWGNGSGFVRPPNMYILLPWKTPRSLRQVLFIWKFIIFKRIFFQEAEFFLPKKFFFLLQNLLFRKIFPHKKFFVRKKKFQKIILWNILWQNLSRIKSHLIKIRWKLEFPAERIGIWDCKIRVFQDIPDSFLSLMRFFSFIGGYLL